MTDEQRAGSIMTVQIGPEHIEDVKTAAKMLAKYADSIANEIGCSSDGSVERRRAKRAKEARKPIARLAEVVAYLKGQMHGD